jgi:hypothetical protein
MNGLTDKQQKMWSFIRDYIIRYGCSPTFAEIAENFSISTAAVARMIRAIEERNGLTRRPGKRGISLLTEDGSEYNPADDEELQLYIPAELTIPDSMPYGLCKKSESNMLFQLADDQMDSFGIRQDDFLEFKPCDISECANGSFVCIKYGSRYFIRIYFSERISPGFMRHIPEHVLYRPMAGCTAVGVLLRSVRFCI